MTDPEARKDPARMREVMSRVGQSARRDVLRAVRLNALIMSVVGVAMLLGGVGVGVAALAGVIPREAGIGGVVLVAMGGLFYGLSRMTTLPPLSLLRNGTACQATVREVKALGRSIGIEKPGISATLSKVTVLLSVQPPGAASIEVEHSQFIMGNDLSRLQVGANVPVRCDPRNPKRLAFDFEA